MNSYPVSAIVLLPNLSHLLSSPPPPPTPPPSQVPHESSMLSHSPRPEPPISFAHLENTWSEINKLYGEKPRLNKDGKIDITITQYFVIFQHLPSRYVAQGTISIGLLELAGGVGLATYQSKPLVPMIAEKLLPQLLGLAMPNKDRDSVVTFWEHTVTSYIHKRVKLTRNGKAYSGILKGASTQANEFGLPLGPNTYKLQISGEVEWSLHLKLEELADGAYDISLDETFIEGVEGNADKVRSAVNFAS